MTEQEWLTSDDPAAMLEWFWGRSLAQQGSRKDAGCSDRKLRLFACACARTFYPALLTDPGEVDFVSAIERAEESADSGQSPPTSGEWIVSERNALFAARMAINDLVQRRADLTLVADLLRDIVGNPFRSIADWWEPCDDEHDPRRYHSARVRQWITPTVQDLARTAYGEQIGAICELCHGTGKVTPPAVCLLALSRAFPGNLSQQESYFPPCPSCQGSGRVQNGSLDPVRLAILADALEEAGCTEDGILRHLRGQEWVYGKLSDSWIWVRTDRSRYRGFWPLDLILGKE